MWTYLLIFLSIAALLIIFVRRAVLYYKPKVEPEKTEKIEEEEEIALIPDAGKISREDHAKVEELCEKGEMLIKAGQDEEAIKMFVQALTIDNEHIDTMNKLAMLYLKKQMYSAASALFKQLSDLTRDPVHYSHLGFTLYQQNAYEEARDAYSEAISLDDSRPQRYVSLAQVYRALEQPQNAIIAISRAIELDDSNAEFLFLLAELYAERGAYESAEQVLKRILDADPGNEDAKRFLKSIKGMQKSQG